MKPNDDLIDVVTSDLRAILFWATIGVTESRGGSREEEICDIIESYAEFIGFRLPKKPRFKGDRKR